MPDVYFEGSSIYLPRELVVEMMEVRSTTDAILDDVSPTASWTITVQFSGHPRCDLGALERAVVAAFGDLVPERFDVEVTQRPLPHITR